MFAALFVPLVIDPKALLPPPPAPQSAPVPETTPVALTCKHWMSPVMFKVGLLIAGL
jgi:hypothetical protein